MIAKTKTNKKWDGFFKYMTKKPMLHYLLTFDFWRFSPNENSFLSLTPIFWYSIYHNISVKMMFPCPVLHINLQCFMSLFLVISKGHGVFMTRPIIFWNLYFFVSLAFYDRASPMFWYNVDQNAIPIKHRKFMNVTIKPWSC